MRAEAFRELGARLRTLATQAASRLARRLLGLLSELWQRSTAHRILGAATLLVLAAILLAGLRAAPLVYGHYALRHAAAIAARQSRIKGEEATLLSLRRRAFDLGLTEAALEEGAFTLAPGLTDDGPVCTVSYAFTHQVNVYGLFRLPVRFRGQVTGVQLDPAPNPGAIDLDERIQGLSANPRS
ncbi:hypothetical protein [Mesoterricola silvestris]|uniref:Uncharacterized protein n=1 Tax=Mesoterricola silvestris TaxID=2927979 RepID=A0AA48GMA4_9BACT|nr:hypothetical protein [Mesoterricola silvestris]BDU73914.1 hypothetical protein METEAL_30880 [Mesoterricola silvestris]